MTKIDSSFGEGVRPTTTERAVSVKLSTTHGEFLAIGYLDHRRGDEQMVLVYGDIEQDGVLTRLHSECLTGDVFDSKHCECGSQLSAALDAIVKRGSGILIYLQGHEGRGIGLLAKLRAMKLQSEGMDTVEANIALGLPVDSRDYSVAAEILHDLGVRSVQLLSNNPRKSESLRSNGIGIESLVPLLIPPSAENRFYQWTKRDRLNHHLPHLDVIED
ncbi:GTP cyclohydrolase II [Streptomyces sp. 21So2-11]|uniref:GTP cyclohydrolase II n=1 Tax=Streptomyces sp. 21So2-11 TaxID=3144408 RepID=UPI003219C2FF